MNDLSYPKEIVLFILSFIRGDDALKNFRLLCRSICSALHTRVIFRVHSVSVWMKILSNKYSNKVSLTRKLVTLGRI